MLKKSCLVAAFFGPYFRCDAPEFLLASFSKFDIKKKWSRTAVLLHLALN